MSRELVGPAEIAEMLGGVSRQRVHQITSRPGFPAPVARLASGTIWERGPVAAWIAKNRPSLTNGSH